MIVNVPKNSVVHWRITIYIVFVKFFYIISFIDCLLRAMTSSIGGTASTMETAAGLSDFAQHVLRQICSQEWVLERCLQNPEELCHTDMLLDSMLTPKQVRHVYIYTFNDIDSSWDCTTNFAVIGTRLINNNYLSIWFPSPTRKLGMSRPCGVNALRQENPQYLPQVNFKERRNMPLVCHTWSHLLMEVL